MWHCYFLSPNANRFACSRYNITRPLCKITKCLLASKLRHVQLLMSQYVVFWTSVRFSASFRFQLCTKVLPNTTRPFVCLHNKFCQKFVLWPVATLKRISYFRTFLHSSKYVKPETGIARSYFSQWVWFFLKIVLRFTIHKYFTHEAAFAAGGTFKFMGF